jgi:spermidine/putrescine transport system permease protein
VNRLRSLFLLPAQAVMAAFFAAPLLIVLFYSFLTRGTYGGLDFPATLENYLRLADPLYLAILGKTLVIALVSTVFCLLLGFPLALFITRSRQPQVFLLLVMVPFWTSFLVRTYAWMFLLRDTGLVNTILLALGIISQPLPMLYTDGAVIVGLVYGYLPFAVLPVYSALERMDPALGEAAADLGATPWETLRRVTIPLTMPGIIAAGVLVFIPCLGTYLTSDLLGGGRSILIGNVIQSQFTTARDWPFGSALALALMGVTGVLMAAGFRQRRGSPL